MRNIDDIVENLYEKHYKKMLIIPAKVIPRYGDCFATAFKDNVA